MKKSVTLTLSDEELFDLQRILLDGDKDEAWQFLKKYLEKPVRAAVLGEGH